MLFLGLLGLIMAGLCALPLWFFRQGDLDALYMLPIGAVGVGLFGTATVTAFVCVFSSTPVLRVDAAGLHVWGSPPLGWEEFTHAEAAASTGEVFLVLYSQDDAAFRARLSWYRRLLAWKNAALVDGAVYVSERLLPMSAEDLADRINRIKAAMEG